MTRSHTDSGTDNHGLIYQDLSYKVRGAAIAVRRQYGPGHKESLYQHALADELKHMSVSYETEKRIDVRSPHTGKTIGYYQPDFVIEDKIIVEIKALLSIPKNLIDQLFYYLRNSHYELGLFINFSGPRLYIKRIIYTNDRKQTQ